MQYSCDSKLLRLPPQPPKVKGAQRPVSATKYQRNSLARHGPFRAGAQHTADRGEMLHITNKRKCVHSSAVIKRSKKDRWLKWPNLIKWMWKRIIWIYVIPKCRIRLVIRGALFSAHVVLVVTWKRVYINTLFLNCFYFCCNSYINWNLHII